MISVKCGELLQCIQYIFHEDDIAICQCVYLHLLTDNKIAYAFFVCIGNELVTIVMFSPQCKKIRSRRLLYPAAIVYKVFYTVVLMLKDEFSFDDRTDGLNGIRHIWFFLPTWSEYKTEP